MVCPQLVYQTEANLCIIEIGDCCAQFPSQGGDNTLRTEKVIGINNQIFNSSADLDQLLWRRSKTTKRIADRFCKLVVCNHATLVSSPAHPGRDKVTELSSIRVAAMPAEFQQWGDQRISRELTLASIVG
jgi:hypothetical protein